MRYDRLSNKQLFEWIKSHRSKEGLLELERRWIDFWERVKDKMHEANMKLVQVAVDMQKTDEKVKHLEESVERLRKSQRNLSKRREDKRLRLIQNNLESVERQLVERDPKPLIPESQWEAFEEFLIKLNGNKPND